MIAVRDRLDSWSESSDLVLGVVSFADAANPDSGDQLAQVPAPILLATDRATYQAYGLGRGTLWNVWGPKTAWRYSQIYRQRGWPRALPRGLSKRDRASEDTMQLGGDFVIGPDGRVVFAYRGQGPWDRPPVDELLAAATRTGA